MSVTAEHQPDTEMDAVDKIIALPTVNKRPEPTPESYAEEIATIKKSFITVIGVFAVLFLVSMIFSPKYNSYHRAQGSTAPPQAATVASATPVTHHAHHRHHGTLATREASFPKKIVVHHLYDQDYSLTWKSMGDGYTYRIYYANNKQMQDAAEVLYKPVDGTLYRFTMNGDPKNVWMVVAPVNANNHEEAFSRPVNIGLEAVAQ